MSRTTIDIGIDLGTTNSAIAFLQHGMPQVIADDQAHALTPSVIRITGDGVVTVGQRPYDFIIADPDNTASEFKRWMGTDQRKRFAASGKELTAPELSAIVLGRLRNNLQQLGEDVTSAVITVPAAFDLTQTGATQQAAALAGIEHASLLQEPIAASLAYGFRLDMDGNNWLVFDLGGGTFDLALIEVRDGRAQVLDHEGDNFLGGKDFDWAIVEQILLPRLAERYDVQSFQRGNDERRPDLGKLKGIAEIAKIELSRVEVVTAMIETTRKPMIDDRGVEIETDISITRGEYEAVIERMVERAVGLSRQVLERNPASPVDSVLLVGGPTLTPLIRRKVEEGVGIRINTSANPLTVVAEGAALFAATQPAPRRATRTPLADGKIALELSYKSVTDDDTALVLVLAPEPARSFELAAQDRSWSSGQLPLADGRVSASVPLRRKGAHTFKVLARSANGTILPAEPETLTITRALTAAAAPLSKSFGVVIDDGSGTHHVNWLVEKGRALPTRATKEFKTTVALVPGGELEVIQVHVVEGEHDNQRPERTRRVGEITITDRDIERPVRAGSPVEVTIEISESRLLTAQAYFSVLDRTFDVNHELRHDEVVAADLAREITAERERVTRLAEHIPAATTRDFHDRLREAAADARAAQGGDMEASQRAFRTLQEVQKGVDTLEDARRVPTALAEAREESEMASTIVMDHGDDGHRARLRSLIVDLDQAAANSSEPDIRRAGEKLGRLRFEILIQQPWFWMGYFRVLATEVREWIDPGQAQLLIQQGESQLQREDIDGLRSTCHSLRALVKPDDEAQLTRFQNVGIRS